MFNLAKNIYPNVDCEIASDNMWVRAGVRKLHTDGKYYLTEVFRSVQMTPESRPFKDKIIHSMFREFNFMVYMFLIHTSVDPQRKNIFGELIYTEDPDQTPDIDRVFDGLISK